MAFEIVTEKHFMFYMGFFHKVLRVFMHRDKHVDTSRQDKLRRANMCAIACGVLAMDESDVENTLFL